MNTCKLFCNLKRPFPLWPSARHNLKPFLWIRVLLSLIRRATVVIVNLALKGSELLIKSIKVLSELADSVLHLPRSPEHSFLLF